MSIVAKPIPMPCRLPKWKGPCEIFRTTTTSRRAEVVRLDKDNTLVVLSCALDEPAVEKYIECAVAVERIRGKGAFNSIVPRAEVYYTKTGMSYVYSKKKAPTRRYPQHVLDLIPQLEQALYAEDIEGVLPPTFGKLDITGDICYDASIPQGGSVGAHSDDEAHWPAVMIYSLGQSRFLRVINKETKATYNVEVAHNSIVLMLGETFQEDYTHQVDKLAKTEAVGTRLSLNIRYKADSTATKRVRRT